MCLGTDFLPGTRLRPLIEQLYGIFTSRIAATEDAFDEKARDYYIQNVEQIQRLKARPLWRRPIARQIQVKSLQE